MVAVPPRGGGGESEPGQLRVEVLFIIFPPVESDERPLETVARIGGGGRAKGPAGWGTSNTLRASSSYSPSASPPPIAQGIMVSKACPTPAAAGRMAQWKVMGGPAERQGAREEEKESERSRERHRERETEMGVRMKWIILTLSSPLCYANPPIEKKTHQCWGSDGASSVQSQSLIADFSC